MTTVSPHRIALTDVRVFDGTSLRPGTVVIEDGRIGTDPAGADVVDCGGAVLVPGFIDAHVHLHGPESLTTLADHGVTTALDMACWPAERLAELRRTGGPTDFRSAGLPAIGPAGPHSRIPGMPDGAVLRSPERAADFVAARLAEGVDYLKVVLEAPGAGGPDPVAVEALVTAAHDRGMTVVAHAATPGAYALAIDVGADVITHVPLGMPLAADHVARMAGRGQVAVPTLTMMEGAAAGRGVPEAFAAAVHNVRSLARAGVLVLAGTDANTQPGTPAQVPHGESLHHELELLVAAGLSPAEALRAATEAPARAFGLDDRGAIRPGLRADLVLLDGDPLQDITATRRISRVWCAGVEHHRRT